MNSKKKILILTEWYLPGRKAGGPVKSIESLVSSLSQVFDFFVLTTNKDLGDSRPYSGVQTMSWQVQKDGSCIYYLNSSNLNKRNLFNAINSISYDYLYINSLYSKWFSIIPLWWRKRNIIKGKIILAPRGMLSEGALNLKSLKKRLFLSTSKILSLHSNVKWHATYSKEVDEIKTEFGNGAKIAVAGNLSIPVKKSDLYLEKKNDELKLFFLARVSKVKNLHVALQSLSALQNIQGQIIYDVYGSIEDEDYLQYCKNIVKNYNGRIKVDFKGEILNNEISHMIQKYHFLLMPTSNENFGHSIFETLQCGIPVIISNKTPWRNLSDFGCGYDIEPVPENFTEILINALQLNNEGFLKLRRNCIEYLNAKFDINKIKSDYVNLFSDD